MGQAGSSINEYWDVTLPKGLRKALKRDLGDVDEELRHNHPLDSRFALHAPPLWLIVDVLAVEPGKPSNNGAGAH